MKTTQETSASARTEETVMAPINLPVIGESVGDSKVLRKGDTYVCRDCGQKFTRFRGQHVDVRNPICELCLAPAPKHPEYTAEYFVEYFLDMVLEAYDTAHNAHHIAERGASRLVGCAIGANSDAHVFSMPETDFLRHGERAHDEPLQRIANDSYLQEYLCYSIERDRAAYIMQKLERLYWIRRDGELPSWNEFRYPFTQFLAFRPRVLETWRESGLKLDDLRAYLEAE